MCVCVRARVCACMRACVCGSVCVYDYFLFVHFLSFSLSGGGGGGLVVRCLEMFRGQAHHQSAKSSLHSGCTRGDSKVVRFSLKP